MPRNPQQNEQARDARKEQIRLEALRQFATRGLFATRIQDIAAGVGMAQGLMYHYYPSKDAIFVDLIEDALDKTNEAALAVRDMQTPAREKILFSLRELVNTIETSERFAQTCRLIAQATNSSAIPSQAQKLVEEKRDIPYRLMAEVMEAGQREGSVVSGDPRQLATLFWASVNGLSIYRASRSREDAGPMPDYRLIASMFLKEKDYIKE